MKIANITRPALLNYVVRQIETFFPDGVSVFDCVEEHFDTALLRLMLCISSVKLWREGEFDYLHSSQYAIFLYFLSNEIWRNGGSISVCNKIFFLNKSLNGIDLFYEICMPEKFFIGHSVGIVLAKATYGNYLVLYQNSTVGKNHGCAPILEDGVILYPNSAIIGNCHVKKYSVISQGVSVINRNTSGHSMVFQAGSGEIIEKKLSRDVLSDIFRI